MAKITTTKVIAFLKDKWIINIVHIDVDIAHRLPNKKNTKRNNIVKFQFRMLKENILKSRKLLKNSSCFINKDLTRENQRVLMCVKRKMNDEVVRLDCHDPPAIENGSANKSNGTTYGSIVEYICGKGYTLNGENSTECHADGTWKNVQLKAQPSLIGPLDLIWAGEVEF
ncbi:SVEP1-like protein [Mya arenaria]|uniref:SVEP1-like protein n=1 Tax=Mya arenaria TaxID=6604 RepID=A0ABY7EA37_MYAAR|nr:SVEP1-like protein [Mya arenaria]